MTTSDDTTLALLQSLLRICRDSTEGYETARRDIPDAEVRREIEGYAKKRTKMVEQITQRIRELRGDPDARSTAAGAVHRAWIDARSATDQHPVFAILQEVERGEDLAVDTYRQALKEQDIDAATQRMLEQHYELVQAAHDRIKQLRDRYAPPVAR